MKEIEEIRSQSAEWEPAGSKDISQRVIALIQLRIIGFQHMGGESAAEGRAGILILLHWPDFPRLVASVNQHRETLFRLRSLMELFRATGVKFVYRMHLQSLQILPPIAACRRENEQE